VTNTSHGNGIDQQEVTTRNRDARRIVAGFESAMPTLADIWRLIDTALADAPKLSAEIDRLRAELDHTRLDRANLLAAARATVGAYLDGEPDPLSYLRDELAARGQLPPATGGRR
jgi:hypothetical protein